MQFWLLRIVHGVNQYLRGTIQTLQLQPASKIIFAREDIIVHNHQLKEKQYSVPLEHTVTFQELAS